MADAATGMSDESGSCTKVREKKKYEKKKWVRVEIWRIGEVESGKKRVENGELKYRKRILYNDSCLQL